MLESHEISSNLSVVHHKWRTKKLVFSWKDSDSMMRRKFQMNSIQYGELPKQYSYWKLYRWNLGDSAKPQRCVKATTASVICAKFQAILLDLSQIQGQKRKW